MHHGVLQRDREAVAPEQCQEPWNPGRRHELQMIGALDGEPQGGHILQRLMIEAVELLIARLELKRRIPPLTQPSLRASATRLCDAVIRCVIYGLAVADRIEQARVPRFAGLEFEFETDPTVSVDRP